MTVLGLGRWCSALLACAFVWLLLGPRRAAADAAQPARLCIELEAAQLVIYAADRSAARDLMAPCCASPQTAGRWCTTWPIPCSRRDARDTQSSRPGTTGPGPHATESDPQKEKAQGAGNEGTSHTRASE